MPPWGWLTVAILSEVGATSALKASAGLSRPLPSVAVVLGYGAAFYCLSLALRTIPMGTAYAIWSGVGIVLVTMVGWFAYGQRVDAQGFVAMALIIAGAVLLNLRG